MIELETQKFLRSFSDQSKAVEGLEENFNIHSNENENENLVQLTYSMGSPWTDTIVQECRGLILEKGTWDVVAYPFRRFYNVQEDCADTVEVESSVLWEKVDGSLIILYPYRGKWNVATRNSVAASGSLPWGTDTFAEKFWEVAGKSDFQFPDPTYYPICFMLKLVGPDNRVVTKYEEENLYLTGARNLQNFRELDPRAAQVLFGGGIKLPETFPFRDVDDVLDRKMKELGEYEEGFVICDMDRRKNDGSFFRVKVKIKSPKHARLAKVACNLHPKTKCLVGAVLDGVSDDLRAILGEKRRKHLERVERKIVGIVSLVEEKMEDVRGYSTRKELAQMIQDFPFKHCIFKLIDGYYENAEDAVMDLRAEHIADYIDRGGD